MLRFIRRSILAAALLLIAGLAMACAEPLQALIFPSYRTLSLKMLGAISSVTGLLPFAVWEILLVLLLLGLLYSVIHMISRKLRFLDWLSGLLLGVSVFAFLFVALWGLNHYAPPLSEELGLEVREYTRDELIAATEYYMGKANTCAGAVAREADGTLAAQDFGALADIAADSYAPLAAEYPIFDGGTQRVKRARLAEIPMNYSGTTGIFIPFTAESTVNPDTYGASLAHTMCHEIAHRYAIAAEDEANFAAFLACEASEDADFRYSGYYSAFIYCYNALYKADPAAASALWTDDYALLRADCKAANVHYDQYEGKVQDAAQKVNDTYLKAFSEESGVQSYGEAADYLISWFLKKST